MKFDGKSGRSASAEARRYIYRCLAITFIEDIANDAGYLRSDDDLDEFDLRRLQKEAPKVLRALLRNAGLIEPKPRPLQWNRIKRSMLKSFRGQHLTHQEQDELTRAHKEDPERYGAAHDIMKSSEVERIRGGIG